MLLAIPLGIALGVLFRGSFQALSQLRFRWGGLAVAGLLTQALLFTSTGEDLAGSFVPAIYLGSTIAVFVAVVRNVRAPGMAVVTLGALSNIAAIAANGGFMPADAGALGQAGLPVEDHLNSVVLASPALRPLTDIFAIPAGLPFANVYSVGDVLIAAGVVVVIVVAMRRPISAGAGEPAAAAAGTEVSVAR